MNNEFGRDLVPNSSWEKKRLDEEEGRSVSKITSFTTKVGPGQNGNQNGTRKTFSASRKCLACLGQHGLWKCDKFKKLSDTDREKLVRSKRLCFKCLNGGHFKGHCPKETFKCQVQGSDEDHNTLLHPTPKWKE